MFLNCRQKHAFSLSHFLTHKKYISWQVFWRFFRNKIQTCSKTVFSFFNYSQIRPICDKSFTSQNLKKNFYRKTDSNTIYSVGNPFRDKFFLTTKYFYLHVMIQVCTSMFILNCPISIHRFKVLTKYRYFLSTFKIWLYPFKTLDFSKHKLQKIQPAWCSL